MTGTSSPAKLAGKRVTVVGLGRFGGGIGVTRWLCGQDAIVTVSDQTKAEELTESVKALAGCDVTLHLGGHEKSDFLNTDLLVVSPAVPKEHPLVVEARAAGVPRTSEINLFLERCRGRLVGVTGSVGKSTTTAMLGEILAKHLPTLVGGNIGRSLLDELPNITPEHAVVLELSSFQLEDTPLVGISPRVAVVTNLLPNHLDRHGSMENYGSAKKNIFRFQNADGLLILNQDCPITSAWAAEAPGRVEFFRSTPVGFAGSEFVLHVPGPHNQANAQAAWMAARQFGVPREKAAAALHEFAGLVHRLQFVTEHRGVRYYNDSKCTTPEGGVVAVGAFEPRRSVVIVGGYDKHVEFDLFGEALARRAKAVVGIGQTRDKIHEAIEQFRDGELPPFIEAADLAAALKAAERVAESGDVILLSPACASYDMFHNYEHRGEVFVQLVMGGE